ncbi:MAG: hypothetical protein AAF570_04435 [Bacteroidota bacterium]
MQFLSLLSFAQGENNIWYFGNAAGLDFNNPGPPTVLSNGQTMQLEGSTSICDSAGNLLMYTEGQSVWNVNHQVMPNGTGLLSGYSCSMAAIIVPLPGSDSLYYIFAVNDVTGGAGPLGFSYSVVDMSLNGGTGDIVSGMKNLPIDMNSSEKVVYTKHSNGLDYWILHRSGTDMKAYLMTSAGFNSTPIDSSGSTYWDIFTGGMQISGDGSKLASCSQDFIEMFDF